MGHFLLHGFDGGQDGGVVAGDDLADVGQGHLGDRTDDVDGDVAGVGDILGALGADDILPLDVVFFLNGQKLYFRVAGRCRAHHGHGR